MFTIAGAGCCLLDYIYAQVDFTAPSFLAHRSKTPGDGGLAPGILVFTEDFEAFSGRDLAALLPEITAGKSVDAANVGGPAVVAMIHAAQILDPAKFCTRFVGAIGADAVGETLRAQLERTPLTSRGLVTKTRRTPQSVVLSDPSFDHGRGERTFLNTIGAAGQLTDDDLPDDFFAAQMVVLGGTGLVPQLHDTLDRSLARAKKHAAFTVVTTVYDFRNQQKNPHARWPIGSCDETYRLTDLLLADREEALRLSGLEDLDQALDFFIARGVGAVVVTNGARDVALRIGSARYVACAQERLPVSQAVVDELVAHPERKGDTTGCGDNFAGGVIANVALQLEAGRSQIDLAEAIAWGAVSGGLACFQMGGVFYETQAGQKRARMAPYLEAYFA